mgnify:CR=1 FL=1
MRSNRIATMLPERCRLERSRVVPGNIAAWLLSEDASYVTGETITADGARSHLNGAVPIPHGTL